MHNRPDRGGTGYWRYRRDRGGASELTSAKVPLVLVSLMSAALLTAGRLTTRRRGW